MRLAPITKETHTQLGLPHPCVLSELERQGGAVKGTLLKGTVTNAYSKRSNPSVPANFETIVYPSNQEKKGFGSQ